MSLLNERFGKKLIIANTEQDWQKLLTTLRTKSRLHIVGVVLEPMPVIALDLIMGQKSISGSPVGSPPVLATLLEFAARHNIASQAEHFPMSRVNEALEHLEAGKAR